MSRGSGMPQRTFLRRRHGPSVGWFTAGIKTEPICNAYAKEQKRKKNSVVRVKVRREACTGGGSGARLQNPLLNAWDSYIRAGKVDSFDMQGT